MAGIVERILDYLKIRETKVLDVDTEERKETRRWPRLLSFMPSAAPCGDDDDDDDDGGSSNDSIRSGDDDVTLVPCDEPDEDIYDEMSDRQSASSPLSRKLNCMYHSARYGLKEGALSGIFFGGGWGIYRYMNAAYSRKESKEEGEDSGASNSEENSTVNDNIIFVTAANGAIALGVFCTFFCCTKAAIYCN